MTTTTDGGGELHPDAGGRESDGGRRQATDSRAAAPAALTAYADLLHPAIEAAFCRLHPPLARVARYHHGSIEADGTPAEHRGKALRPALTLLCAEAVGGNPRDALPGAVAVELVHDFSLLHDDVMDNDTSRRHRPTAWTVFGTGAAILAGDALLAVADGLLGEIDTPPGARARTLLSQAVLRLVAGQMDDLDFERRMDVSFADYLVMASGKTAALLAGSCALGAALAGASEETVAGLADFGEHVGLAFQLVDDVLGIWGDPATTGKPVLADIAARKKSAPVVAALDADPAAGATAPGTAQVRELREHLEGSGFPGETALQRLAGVIERAGGRAKTEDEIARQLDLAETALTALPLREGPAAALMELAGYVTTRNR